MFYDPLFIGVALGMVGGIAIFLVRRIRSR